MKRRRTCIVLGLLAALVIVPAPTVVARATGAATDALAGAAAGRPCTPGWSQPTLAETRSSLVDATAAGNQVWAVGMVTPSQFPRYPISGHWNGSDWQNMPVGRLCRRIRHIRGRPGARWPALGDRLPCHQRGLPADRAALERPALGSGEPGRHRRHAGVPRGRQRAPPRRHVGRGLFGRPWRSAAAGTAPLHRALGRQEPAAQRFPNGLAAWRRRGHPRRCLGGGLDVRQRASRRVHRALGRSLLAPRQASAYRRARVGAHRRRDAQPQGCLGGRLPRVGWPLCAAGRALGRQALAHRQGAFAVQPDGVADGRAHRCRGPAHRGGHSLGRGHQPMAGRGGGPERWRMGSARHGRRHRQQRLPRTCHRRQR